MSEMKQKIGGSLSKTDRHKILAERNDTVTNQPTDQCLHQLFEAQAAKTPDAVAISFGLEQLTYRELNKKANQLAHYLRKMDVGPETLVGMFVERSLELVVGILGILKAGGAYVPFDLAYPRDRLSFMFEDANIRVLLTQKELLEDLYDVDSEQPSLTLPETICLDDDWNIISKERSENPRSDITGKNLAYVIYTSGTTGKPKGVLVTHFNVIRLFESTEHWYHFGPLDVWTMFHSYAFDFSVWEIWGALLYGGRLVIVGYITARSPEAFLELLCREKVTVLNQTPSAFRQLIWADALSEIKRPLYLRYVIFGGEALDLQSVLPWFERHGDVQPQLINMYGITETTVHVTYRPISLRDVTEGVGSVIGEPIPDLQIYLLDNKLHPVADRSEGEIYVGGAGVARGYLNRPDLTAERFIVNQFSESAEDLLYKTGDLARRLPNGDMEYLGRLDDQIKIRGFRIELGEISSVLNSHPSVRESVVVVDQMGPGGNRLIAYVVFDQTIAPITQLRDLLKKQLPDYMLPAAFIVIDKMPLTPNGKVDRQALPDPDSSQRSSGEAYVAPKTSAEKALAYIWAEVLNIENVGIYDDFFEFGGHSLLATRLISRIRDRFSVNLTMADLYENSTIVKLAEKVGAAPTISDSDDIPPITRVSRTGDQPVSFPQERLVFITKLAPNSIAYNSQSTIHFTGELNIDILNQTLSEIIERHEIYRTTFHIVDGYAKQRVQAPWKVNIPLKDLQKVPDTQRAAHCNEVVAAELKRPFQIEQLPLIRWVLYRLGPADHILLHVEHHLVHDGLSFALFLSDFKALYTAFSNSKVSPLNELPIQFGDFAIWQRQWFEGKRLQPLLDYWKQQLDFPLPILELPTDFPRPARQSFNGAEKEFVLSPRLSDSLRELSRKENASLFVTMLTTFYVLLYHNTNQQDIIVGTGIANRRVHETESLIGMIVNTLALRIRFSPEQTFRELIQQVRKVFLEADAHQDLPFDKLVEELQPERDLSRNPIFQVLFAFHDAQVPELQMSGLKGDIKYLHNGSAKFDMNVIVIPRAEQLVGLNSESEDKRIVIKWEYATDLFKESTIQRMTEQYQLLLEDVITGAGKPLGQLNLMDETAKDRLLVKWNDTVRRYPNDQCVHQLFEAQANKNPHNVAVIYENKKLTYAELNLKANKLAHYLISFNVGPDVPVGLCMERSFDMIVGVLGILKAGGAYVPIDPTYPVDRQAFMLEDTQVTVLLTQDTLVGELPKCESKVICLDRDWDVINNESDKNPDIETVPDNLAYINYTSGSTGRPKGVEIPHRGVTRLVYGLDDVSLDVNKTILHMAPISFDASTFEIWGALLHGARCVLSPVNVPTPKEFQDILHRYHIDTLWLTAAFFNLIIDENPEALTGIKQLITGGESLSVPHIRKAQLLLTNTQIINGYGPTESTTFTTCYPLPEKLGDNISSIPIGRPIGNTQAYILSAHMKPVPIGVTGELYIGGDGLARGYLNRPELNTEKFVPNPFNGTTSSRLYKTGDRVRFLPDGNIEFLERMDRQVKIRGFRVELGEIETVLKQHSAVREAVVLMREDEPGDKRLVAYIIFDQDDIDCNHELRSFIRKTIPEYMVPSAFVVLDVLPLTPNGKIDRKALTALDSSQESEELYVAPRTQIEEEVSEIWQDLLRIKRIGIHRNFFELGGHSLLAMQMMSRLRASFQIELPLNTFFELPTIAELSSRITQIVAKQTNDEISKLLEEVEGLSEEEALSRIDKTDDSYD